MHWDISKSSRPKKACAQFQGAGEEHSKGSFYITPLDGKNFPDNIPPSKERHDNFQINLVGVATLT